MGLKREISIIDLPLDLCNQPHLQAPLEGRGPGHAWQLVRAYYVGALEEYGWMIH